MQLQPQGPAYHGSGPEHDVVTSCRVRLARNLAGFPFVNQASDAQCHEVVGILQRVLLEGELVPGLIWVDMNTATVQDRSLLAERHLISRPHAEAEVRRATAISENESLSVMINEEDHLRIQAIGSGLQFTEVFERINSLDDAIESKIDYAFSKRWGYLTACPTNIGTGIRFSVMMHLPGLKITNELDRVKRSARDLHLAVRGYYGEGSEAIGDFYQISNQVTLGRSEIELLDEFEHKIVPQIIEYERRARQMLEKRSAALLDDRIHRALGTLRSARLLGVEEAMKLLSRVRLGVQTHRIDDVDTQTIDRLFLQIQPAHLRQHAGAQISGEDLRKSRAEFVRSALQ